MHTLQAQANGKINLTLDVLGRRDDGYHELSSVMQSISLCDQVTLSRDCPAGIALDCDGELPNDDQNLAWRAAEVFFAAVDLPPRISITIRKGIPAAAGLGGGSADAAAVLTGLDLLFAVGMQPERLQALGLKLGADVPFCLTGGSQWARGIGEKLTPLPAPPPFTVLLVKPAESISTASVYRQLEPGNFGERYTPNFVSHWRRRTFFEGLPFLGNALEAVTASAVPEITDWKHWFMAQGAKAALMSGSGPTVFAIFDSEERADRVYQQCWQKTNLWVCRPEPVGIRFGSGATEGRQ